MSQPTPPRDASDDAPPQVGVALSIVDAVLARNRVLRDLLDVRVCFGMRFCFGVSLSLSQLIGGL